jgi:hypothetical protein
MGQVIRRAYGVENLFHLFLFNQQDGIEVEGLRLGPQGFKQSETEIQSGHYYLPDDFFK